MITNVSYKSLTLQFVSSIFAPSKCLMPIAGLYLRVWSIKDLTALRLHATLLSIIPVHT